MKRFQSSAPVYFDLDGTLVDSANGIIVSLEQALAVCGIACQIDWRKFIGPPLQQMLALALPDVTSQRRADIGEVYREHYSTIGVFMTTPFPGVTDVVAAIAARKSPIFVVTNKPQQPAEMIIKHIGIESAIQRVIGGDPSGLASKPQRAEALINQERLEGGCFVGDGIDDLVAAERIGAKFLLAGWGYGADRVFSERPNVERAERPRDILNKLDS